jgi:hypothetical protein
VPILGTAIGGIVGAGVGVLGLWLGVKARRAIGEGLGEAVADGCTSGASAALRQYGMYASTLPPQITQPPAGIAAQKVDMTGQAVMDVNVTVTDESPKARVNISHNSIPAYMFSMPSGSATYARSMP